MTDQPAGQTQETQMSPKSANGNGSQPSSHASQIALPELKQSSTPKSAQVERIEQPSIHKSTGPRTPQGKARSRLNALKHGLLSKAVLLKDESGAEYESLRKGFQESLQPQGELEAQLVEYLAILWWRKRRLLQAETTEIAKAKLLNLDRALQKAADELEYAQLNGHSDGKLTPTSKLNVFRNAIHLLGIARLAEGNDSQAESVLSFLRSIYGGEEGCAAPYGLRQLRFAVWKLISTPPEGEGIEYSADLHEFADKPIEKEMVRLAELHDAALGVEKLVDEYETATRRVPPAEVSDRLLRHEAHFSREFDRTLSQLERLQRMRMGQPVLPPIKLDISS